MSEQRCMDRSWHGYSCTREAGHDGRHQSGDAWWVNAPMTREPESPDVCAICLKPRDDYVHLGVQGEWHVFTSQEYLDGLRRAPVQPIAYPHEAPELEMPDPDERADKPRPRQEDLDALNDVQEQFKRREPESQERGWWTAYTPGVLWHYHERHFHPDGDRWHQHPEDARLAPQDAGDCYWDSELGLFCNKDSLTTRLREAEQEFRTEEAIATGALKAVELAGRRVHAAEARVTALEAQVKALWAIYNHAWHLVDDSETSYTEPTVEVESLHHKNLYDAIEKFETEFPDMEHEHVALKGTPSE